MINNDIKSRCIGIVDSVSSREIKGFLLDDAPATVSIMEGNISFFPRINSYLVIPNEAGWLVGIISWIGYNHANNINNEVNLPQGSRMIYLYTIGHIKETLTGLEFERGTFSLPTVGDSIVLPTMKQLNAIVANNDKGAKIAIGTSQLAGNQKIEISVDNLFGRHLAVLGNTGSGKSCTVAGIIRWSIEESVKIKGKSPNARFIILDPNGEYKNAFSGLNMDIKYCSIKADVRDTTTQQLKVPAWMWTSQEWSGVLLASGKTQKPLLREALRDLKASHMANATQEGDGQSVLDLVKVHLYNMHCFIKESILSQAYLNNDKTKFGKELRARSESMDCLLQKLGIANEHYGEINSFIEKINTVLQTRLGSGTSYTYYNVFSIEEIQDILADINLLMGSLGNIDERYLCNEDDPIEFDLNNLAPYLQSLAQDSSTSQYIDYIAIRIKSMLRNATISTVIGNQPEMTLLSWIKEYVSNSDCDKGQICIIDLSIVPSDIVHLIVAVVTRLIFESLQRYRKHYGRELPTLLVMEEAHTFIKRYNESSDDFSADKLCTQVFERVAREGRKFGLGLIISSQRPSELSPTVLSQCNSYILHRIVNDKDQEMIKKLVPDNLGSMLDELPSLPRKKAIVLGSAVPIPTIVEINDLPECERPKSDDPQFWDVWTGKEERELDWQPIIKDWQRNN